MEQNQEKTSTGLQANVAALLSYVLGFITGIVFFVIEKDNKFVRFHAMQSIVVSGSLFVAQIVLRFVPFVGFALSSLLSLLGLALWIILMIKAYQGELFKLPVAGDIAEKNS
ncbi:MAG: DUF4870 domain-containing protein [Candidatus Omnitrophica bacterium]|nr:DUF4870 domain-containing protein [Candidatus Omnitrophota bacterium]